MLKFVLKNAVCACILLIACISAKAELPKVQIFVTEFIESNGIRYRYQIVNNGKKEIYMVTIGYCDSPEMSYFPAKPFSFTSPTGWKGLSISYEAAEGNPYMVEWKNYEIKQGTLVSPGKAMDGFSVKLSSKYIAYINSPFVVSFLNDNDFCGKLEEAVSSRQQIQGLKKR